MDVYAAGADRPGLGLHWFQRRMEMSKRAILEMLVKNSKLQKFIIW